MMKRLFFILCLLSASITGVAQDMTEPSMDLAKLWWPEQWNVWTPVGWPDHYFKFAVVYNGTVLVSPGMPSAAKPHAKRWLGEDFQLTFCASADGHPWPMPGGLTYLRDWEGGLGIQHWDPDHETPVLQTEFRSRDGIVLQTDAFAHIRGGGDVQSGIEPEYIWIRVKVKHVDEYAHPDRYRMSVLLTRLFLGHTGIARYSADIGAEPSAAHCDRPLQMDPQGDAFLVRESESRKLRLGVTAGPGVGVEWSEAAPARYNLVFDFPAEEGAWADLLFPVLVDGESDFLAEMAVTREGALAEGDRYWAAQRPATAATFDVPEEYINEAVRQNFKIDRVLGEKDYETGAYSYITGVWQYDALWPTPSSMLSTMFLDLAGYFDDTERYTEVFRRFQGTSVAPGSSYKQHPGYFSSPRYLESVDWLSDYGAIMYQAATHCLLSGNRDYIARWTEPLVKGCEFLMEYSRGEHEGVAGLLPAGWSTDEEVPLQSVWSLAWNYKGLSETVRLLRKEGHPRAEEFAAFQREFKETFQREYRRVCEAGPRWTDDRGAVRFRPPTELYVEAGSRFQTEGRPAGHTFMTDAFYLDGGPLSLVWAGLLDADDPIMRDMADFFREGPNVALWKPVYWCLDRAILIHEISSCEPCYSFNVFHSWQLGDRARYLEGMYSLFAGSISQNTFISCEHRHGIMGLGSTFPLPFWMARNAVIDERIVDGELHLMRFCPLAWLRSDRPARFLKMPTEYGPVDLTLHLSEDGKTLDVRFRGDWREEPGRIVLHVPPVPGLKKVCVNGKRYSASKPVIQWK